MNGTLENGANKYLLHNISGGNYPTLPPVYTAANSINLLLGVPVNGYVLWLILSGAGGGTTASEFFFLNLILSALASLLSSVFYFLLLLKALCAAQFVFYFSVPSFQCCVCVERYVAVVHPVAFLGYKALRYRAVCCGVVWLVVLPFSVGFTLHTSVALLDDIYTTAIYVLLGFYVACVSVVSFCCLAVLRALKRPGPGEGQRDGTGGEGNDMKRRAFGIIRTSLVVMLLTMTIFGANLAACLLQNTGQWSVYVVYVTFALTLLSGLVHPLVYIHKAGKLSCSKGQ